LKKIENLKNNLKTINHSTIKEGSTMDIFDLSKIVAGGDEVDDGDAVEQPAANTYPVPAVWSAVLSDPRT